jgi:3-oxoacyl-[acyl-carrier protein] reductase
MFDFTDRVAVITGGAAGIGRGLVLALARAHASVAVWDLNIERGSELVAKLKNEGRPALFQHCDVSNPTQVEQASQAVIAEFGGIDILLNNAGITHPRVGFERMDYSTWRRILAVNVDGTFIVSRSVVASMISRGKGAIINTGSVLGDGTFPGKTAYTTSKAAIIGLTKAMALDLAQFRIRVNCVIPGSVDSEMMWEGLSPIEKVEAEHLVAKELPLGRVGTPDDIAHASMFLASDLAGYITGQSIFVDGGRTFCK